MTIKEHLKRIVFVAIVFLTVGVVGYGFGWIIITLVKDKKQQSFIVQKCVWIRFIKKKVFIGMSLTVILAII